MKEQIMQKLQEIEHTQNIKILHAVESGSRAWGFASYDSDYDVRFIYVHPKEFYLKLEKTRDVLEYPIDASLDINGWDFAKALRLLHISNPTVFEWYHSPIIYQTTPFSQDLIPKIQAYFSPKASLWHYLNTASKNYHRYLNVEQVRLKQYFYVIRPLLACRWILKHRTAPPMPFHTLVETQLEPEWQAEMKKLLNLKMQTPEIETLAPIPALHTFIEQNLSSLKEEVQKLPKEPAKDWSDLNTLFLNALDTLFPRNP